MNAEVIVISKTKIVETKNEATFRFFIYFRDLLYRGYARYAIKAPVKNAERNGLVMKNESMIIAMKRATKKIRGYSFDAIFASF
mgnify:CR=1 FL=1